MLGLYFFGKELFGFFIEKENEMLYAIGADSETLEPCLYYAIIK